MFINTNRAVKTLREGSRDFQNIVEQIVNTTVSKYIHFMET